MESFMPLIRSFRGFACALFTLRRILFQCLWRTPAAATHLACIGTDLVRSRQELIVENMFEREKPRLRFVEHRARCEGA
jgi:hypothetical protein